MTIEQQSEIQVVPMDATQERFSVCHAWRPGDLLTWKNLAILHRRDAFDPGSRRLLHRTQIKGDVTIT